MNKKSLFIIPLILIFLALANVKAQLVEIPMRYKMEEYQMNYITISTVFAGFSFTILGIMLGVSSEELIKRVNKTDIILDQVNITLTSIMLFMISVAISMVFVLGLDNLIVRIFNNSENDYFRIIEFVDSILYVLGTGYLIGGMISFVLSVKNFYKLIVHIYTFNKRKSSNQITKLQNALNNKKKESDIDDEDELVQ